MFSSMIIRETRIGCLLPQRNKAAFLKKQRLLLLCFPAILGETTDALSPPYSY